MNSLQLIPTFQVPQNPIQGILTTQNNFFDEQLINHAQIFNRKYFNHSPISSYVNFGPPSPPVKISQLELCLVPNKKLGGEIFTKVVITNISEDSIYRKILACVPIIGVAISYKNENSLRKKINRCEDLTQTIKLIEIKNHYKNASFVRSLITTTLIAVGVAYSILNPLVGLCSSFFIADFAAGYLKNKLANEKIIKEMKDMNINNKNLIDVIRFQLKQIIQ